MLDQRYFDAVQRLKANGAEATGAAFEAAARGARAIFSTNLSYALNLFDERRRHRNYHEDVEGGGRTAAEPHDDAMRLTVDAQVFGTIGRRITMAALTLTSTGLPSYGAVSMEFHPSICEARASLLSENSFDFVRRNPGGPDALPAGHRSTWADRGRLALVKSADELKVDTAPAEFPHILMRPGSSRKTDRFMEVHLYESWGIDAVVAMRVRKDAVTNRFEQAQAAELGDRLRTRGILWEMV